jgi:hypothetical protein
MRVGQITALAQVREAAWESKGEGETDDSAFIQVRTGDLAVIGLTLLNRCGRITASLYLQILGGYVRHARFY